MPSVRAWAVTYWLDLPGEAYPPLDADERVDVAVVGGGVTGSRAPACSPRRECGSACSRRGRSAAGERPQRRVRPTRRRRVLSGDPRPRALGAQRGRSRAASQLAGEAFRRVGSLRVAASDEELAAVRDEHDTLREDGFAVEWVEAEELPPLLRPHFLGGLRSPRDGALEPGRWARRLAALAARAGAAIAEGTRVTAVEPGAVRAGPHTVSCDSVVVAADGYSGGVLPELAAAIRPARAQMLATAPLTERHFDAPVYARDGWDYWQQAPDGRLVIGGWRDAELEREFTSVEEPTPTLQARIEEFAGRLLGSPPSVTHRWAGLLGFTEDLRPLVGGLREGVWVSAGYSGHGNVLALACGELVAKAIVGRPAAELDLFEAGIERARN